MYYLTKLCRQKHMDSCLERYFGDICSQMAFTEGPLIINVSSWRPLLPSQLQLSRHARVLENTSEVFLQAYLLIPLFSILSFFPFLFSQQDGHFALHRALPIIGLQQRFIHLCKLQKCSKFSCRSQSSAFFLLHPPPCY